MNPSRWSVIWVYATLIFLVFPALVIVPISFTPERYLSFAQYDWSLRHYQTILTGEKWLPAIGESILIAVITGLMTTLLGSAFALALWLWRPPGRRSLIVVVMLPLIAPQIVSGLIIYFLEAYVGVLGSRIGLILGHTIIAAPYSVICLFIGTSRLDRRLVQAASNLGAGTGYIIWTVILPLLRPAILASAVTAFMISWEEVVVTILISGVEVATLPKRIWEGLRDDIDPAIAAISVIIIALTILAISLPRLRVRDQVVSPA